MYLFRYASALTLAAVFYFGTFSPASAQTAQRGYTLPFDGVLSSVAAPSSVARGGAGSPDESFGEAGIVSFTAPEANTVAFQPDGKILVAGRSNGDAAVFRLLPDGSFDTDFGTDGIATADLGSSIDFFGSLAVQPDGSIIAAGSKFLTGNGDGDGAALARFLPGGTLDTGFGTDGIVLELGTPESDTPDAFWSVHLRPDGRIIAGGMRGVAFTGDEDNACYAAQYLPDGSRDPDFGTDGLVSADPDADIFCLGGVLMDDGRYVLSADLTNAEWGAARLLEDGTFDASFGTDGIARADRPVGFLTYGVAVGADGSVTLSGFSPSPATTLLRFTANGALDTNFGTDGVAALGGLGPSRANNVVRQPDGKYLLTGDAQLQSGDIVALLARVLSDGELDSSFGASAEGATHLTITQGSMGIRGWTVALDDEQRIVVVGNDYGPSPSLGFVARFENDLSVATEQSALAKRLALNAPFPNPVSGHAVLAFELTEPSAVRLALYDMLGREVAVLVEGARAAGAHEVALDASRLASGLYVVRLTAGGEKTTRRLTVVR